jgi:hypothetical protein
MKALSVKQPWAWLICAGYKDIENRNWPIGRSGQHGPYQFQKAEFTLPLPGRVYVHAGKQPDEIGSETFSMIYKNLPLNAWQYLWNKCKWSEKNFGLDLGAIIGEVDITGCVTQSDSPWFVGKYGFVLANPVLYKTPVACRGQLGFFELGEEVEYRIRMQI